MIIVFFVIIVFSLLDQGAAVLVHYNTVITSDEVKF